MRRLIIVFIILNASQFCFSQTGTIKGYIHDTYEKEALAFANVILIGHKIGANTDLDGNFIIESIPVGSYDLKITYVGYPDATLTSINVSKDTIIDLYIDYPPPCEYNQSDKTCPICKKKNQVIPIIYGLPNKRLLNASKKEKVRLGGCTITACDPKWYCKRDEKEF